MGDVRVPTPGRGWVKQSISRRFSYALTGAVALALLGFAALAILLNLTRMNRQLNDQLDTMERLAEASLVAPLWNFDTGTVNGFVEALFLYRSIVYVAVLDEERVLVSKARPEFRGRDFSHFEQSTRFLAKSADIRRDGIRIGSIRLAMSRDSVQQELILNVIAILALAVFIIGAISTTSVFITRRYVSRPLARLQSSATRIAHGDLDAFIDSAGEDETARLAKDLSSMRDSIKQLFGALEASREKLEEYNRTLELSVEERTTELAHAVREAQEARAGAEEANEAKSQFLANMSHELRTPLNAIIGYAEMLREDVAESGRREMVADLEKIYTAGKHLLSLIDDILDLSKIEAGRMDLHLEVFAILPAVEQVVSTIAPLAERNENTVIVRVGRDLGTMRGDLTKVRQSLFNLMSNACKFTERGRITVDVGREAVNGIEWVTFRVSDTGIGMTREQLEKVFQAFSQADTSTTRKYGGTGLGLAISQRFCRMMGGDITVDSAVGRGSTFTIRLPAEVSEP